MIESDEITLLAKQVASVIESICRDVGFLAFYSTIDEMPVTMEDIIEIVNKLSLGFQAFITPLKDMEIPILDGEEKRTEEAMKKIHDLTVTCQEIIKSGILNMTKDNSPVN